MDYKYILRDIKLSKFTDTPMSDEVAKLIEFWNDLWCDMEVSIDADKGEIRCWKDDLYYIRQEGKNNHLMCYYYKVWAFFKEELGLDYAETQNLIQYMVDTILNCKVNTPFLMMPQNIQGVDTILNCKVNTPHSVEWYMHKGADKILNCKMNNQ